LQNKKILHVISGLSDGGAEGALYRLIQFDNINKHEVVSLTDGGIYSRKMINIGVDVHLILMPRGKITFQGLLKLYRVIKNSNADVIQTWMYHADLLGGLIAKFIGNLDIYWGIRGPYNKERTSFSTKVTIWLCAMLSYWVPKKIISNSHYAKNVHVAIGYSAKKFAVVDNGYSYNKFSNNKDKVEFCHEYDVNIDTPILGMVARFDPHKDHENFISAMQILSNKKIECCCLLIGSGMDKSNRVLLSLIEKYNVNSMVRLVGQSDKISEIMSFLDIHILSSVAESFPNVLAEAMISGTPCITTNVGDAKRIVGDTGWVVPAENAKILAEAIENAILELRNSNLWHLRQKACVDRVEAKFSMNAMIFSFHEQWFGIQNDEK
jgi:glycosyltransferase involved in cell wall biosynthesis